MQNDREGRFRQVPASDPCFRPGSESSGRKGERKNRSFQKIESFTAQYARISDLSDASEPRGSIWVGRTLRSRILGRFRVFRPKTCIFNTRTRQKITVLDVFRCFRATARREAPQKCQNDVKYTFSKGLLNSSRNYAVPLRYNKISDPFRNQKSPIGSRWDTPRRYFAPPAAPTRKITYKLTFSLR